MAVAIAAAAQHLVILHTNDIHSNIDPTAGVGGVLQRKALIDSVRKAEKNVMLVDAGDIVQGPLYFKLYRGELEYPLMDMMGYDIQILGNHEFDNGLEELAKYYKGSKTTKLSANYDFDGTPLEGVFKPYIIKKIDGKKVGFLGLNLNPDGIIAKENYKGMGYTDIIETGNEVADYLRNTEKCDVIVAVTHIGYDNDGVEGLTTDPELAENTRNLDIIIGGHSHTLVDPADPNGRPYRFKNLDGKDVIVVQTGRYGAKLGKIDVDLSNPQASVYSLIDIEGVDPTRFDKKMERFIAPYKHVVDSINATPIAMVANDMMNKKKYTESITATNNISDIAQWYGTMVLDSLSRTDSRLPKRTDLAIMNSGGVRKPMPKGVVTEGDIYAAFPFPNNFWIMRFTGEQLADVLRQVAEKKNAGVSRECIIAIDPETNEVTGISIGGQAIDPERDYYVSTIDYLGNGNDYLTNFKEGEVVWTDDKEMSHGVMRYVVEQNALGIPLGLDTQSRIIEAQRVGTDD